MGLSVQLDVSHIKETSSRGYVGLACKNISFNHKSANNADCEAKHIL